MRGFRSRRRCWWTMNDEELSQDERKVRLLHRVRNVGQVCLDCGESLTKAERELGWSYCLVCWPLCERKEVEDDGK